MHARRRRWLMPLVAVGIVVVLVLVVFATVGFMTAFGRQRQEKDQVVAEKEQVAESGRAATRQAADGRRAARCFLRSKHPKRDCAAQASAVASQPAVVIAATGSPGQSGRPGRGPSQEQVTAAVALYCASGRCEGTRGGTGKRGKPGQAPSPADVAAAVATYCGANGDCIGPQGQQGDPPTADQVAAAVAAYCDAHDGCRGPKGDTGADGARGRGIDSVTCGDDDQFHVHYSDGSTDTVGRCRPAPATSQPDPSDTGPGIPPGN